MNRRREKSCIKTGQKKIMCMSIHQLVGEREALWDSYLIAPLSLRGRTEVPCRVECRQGQWKERDVKFWSKFSRAQEKKLSR